MARLPGHDIALQEPHSTLAVAWKQTRGHARPNGGATGATSWGMRRAEHVINSAEEDIGKRVREITGGKGVDAAVDPIGGETSGKVLSTLKRGGVLRVYGTLSGKMQLPFGNVCSM